MEMMNFDDLVSATTQHKPIADLRLERNKRLAETDWWCCSDQTPTQAQLDYRQALRDLPANSSPSLDEWGQLTNVEWPVKPDGAI